MKWGQRRARKYAEKAKTARDSAKEWDEISRYAKQRGKSQKKIDSYKKHARKDRADAKKYSQKSKKIELYHRELGGSKTYDRVKGRSTIKLVGESYVMGTYGALKYEQARAANKSRGMSVIKGVASAAATTLTYGIVEVVEPRLSSNDKRKAKKVVKNAANTVKNKVGEMNANRKAKKA